MTTTTTPLHVLDSAGPTISVPETAALLGVSRSFAYEMARDGRLPVVKLGPRRVRVVTAALAKMLDPERK